MSHRINIDRDTKRTIIHTFTERRTNEKIRATYGTEMQECTSQRMLNTNEKCTYIGHYNNNIVKRNLIQPRPLWGKKLCFPRVRDK